MHGTRDLRRVASAAFVGTALEWYDYFLFGAAAALVFDRVFFPDLDPSTGLIASFLTFAVGFVVRPLGGILFGHIGDRFGRRRALTATLLIMGLSTGAIGLLPGYQQIGFAAPLLLAFLRCLQGMSAAGEWSGATLMAVEHAPAGRRGWYGAMPQYGAPAGTLLSSGAMALATLLPDEQFLSWGWRVPFLVSFALLVVAFQVRRRVEESPLFQRESREKVPVLAVLRGHWREVLIALSATIANTGGLYLLTTFLVGYGTSALGLSRQVMLAATLIPAALEFAVMAFSARLTDRFGPARICVSGSLLSAVTAFPVFLLVDTRSPALVVLGAVIGISMLTVTYAALGTLLASIFPPPLRYTGVAMGVNLAGVVGGLLPYFATQLLVVSGNASWPAATLLLAISVWSLLGSLAAQRRTRAETEARQPEPAA
ncbi:MFS transporter [Saccharopolyspora sp. NPDC002686]|uniref:MFS transporter n=1 Tax=Saccharopolyspora sp. NPDC002686 TaxID=3154541 RepID=UPI00331FC077